MTGCAMMTTGGALTAIAAQGPQGVTAIGPILYLLGMLVFFVGRFIYVEARNTHEKIATKTIQLNQRLCKYLFSTSCLLIPGFILLAMVCRLETIYLKDYEYNGVMRVTGWAVENSVWETDELDTAGTQYLGKPRVAFGEQWGCPSTPATWCEVLVYEPDCVFPDREQAAQCVREKYKLYEASSSSSSVTPTSSEWTDDDYPVVPDFDRSKAPDLDPSWPHYAVFHGDCDTCTIVSPSEVEAKVKFVNKIKRTGTALSVVGMVLYGSFFVLWVAYPAISRKRQEAFISAELAVPEATSPSTQNDMEQFMEDAASVESLFCNECDDDGSEVTPSYT
jgi:hypothetical protein